MPQLLFLVQIKSLKLPLLPSTELIYGKEGLSFKLFNSHEGFAKHSGINHQEQD